MKSNVVNDLSVLTTINEQSLIKLFDKIDWCIADVVEQTILSRESTAEIDLGFGTLVILISNDEIKYKFKPSANLEKSVADTVLNERNLLTKNIEASLVSKITNTYKNFF